MRSSWERIVAEKFDSKGIIWKYESKRFVLSDGRSYLPDFFLPDFDVWIEVKGLWHQKSKEKFEVFRKEFPEIIIYVVMKELLKDDWTLDIFEQEKH